MFKKTLALTLAACVTLPTLAQAQVTVSPGLIDRVAPEVTLPKKFQLNTKKAQPIKDAPQLESVSNPNAVLATLRQVNFTGATKVEEELLQVIAAPFLDRPITNKDLADLKYRVAQEYYRRGYSLVKAVTPQQNLSDGTLDLRVIEATVGNVAIKQNDVVKNYVVDGMLKSVKEGGVFNELDAETLVSDINDLQGVRSTINLAAGDAFATTNIDVFVESSDDDVNYVTFDNYGSELTGEFVGQVHLEKGNLLGLGERFYVDGRLSDEDLWSAGGGVDLPTGFRNVIFHTSYYYTENDIGEFLEPAGIEGESETLDAHFSSALVNTRDKKAEVKVGLEARRHESTLQKVTQWEDNIRRAYVDGSYLHRTDNAVWYAAANLSKGVDILGASDKNGFPQPSTSARSNLNGTPEATILRPTFFVNYRPSKTPILRDGSFKFGANAQISSNELLSSDQFVLGGYGSVRGFEPAFSTGDAGIQFSAEYQQDIPVIDDVTLLVGPWIDGGMVSNRSSGAASGVVDNHLYSAGLGAELIADILPVGDTTLRLDVAFPLGDYDQPGVDDSEFYFRVSQYF